ncbi:MAG TPA: hypothetical protein VMV14_11530 [Acidimicrobiales bacterium]|nr:hypothetical protein [Acidimicrobiales bacterium]
MGELEIIRGKHAPAVNTVSVKQPPGEKQCRALVALSKGLGSGDSKGKDTSRDYGII